VAAALFPWLGTVRLRQALFALCSAGFVYTLVPDAKTWIALGVFLASGYGVARMLQLHPSRWILATYITLLLAVFLVLKRYDFLVVLLPAPLFAHGIVLVGLSYLLFRQIHVAVDALQGQIERLTLWTYLNYQLNLFGLLAGPIQRYQEFEKDWNRLEPLARDWYEILRSYRRIFVGIIKVAVVAAYCLLFYERFAELFAGDTYQLTGRNCGKLLLFLYLYPLYIYFNFSGYCDIVIGAASLLGVRMPENFDWPFLSRNMIEYWSRYHQTLGLWIRDYLFTPLYMTLAGRMPSQAASLAFVSYFVAFFLVGIWHGSTWNFVIFGLLNGLGVAAAKLWENLLVKRRGRQTFKAYLRSRPIRVFCIVATFHYVCLTLLFFPSDLHRTFTILANLGARFGS